MKRILIFAALAAAALGAGGAEEPVVAPGTVRAFRSSYVNAEVVGNVSEILVEEGRRVEEGQVLCKLASAVQKANHDLAKLQAQDETALDATEKRLEQADRDLDRARKLDEGGTGSVVDLEKAQNARDVAAIEVEAQKKELEQLQIIAELRKATLDQYTIRAPFSGIVAEKSVEVGESTYPLDKRLFHIVDTRKVYIEAQPNMSLLGKVETGMQVTVKVRARPGRIFPAEITFIAPTADIGGRSFGIKAIVDNSEGLLMPGMVAEVCFDGSGAAETPE